ncbi:MAG: VOC family protein [Dehalococcoidia bacterium]|nr:VOC family protein [Dehalococcoidia bacterium]
MSTLKLGPVRQVGYVVKDIEKSMREWLALGVGPWHYIDNLPIENFHYMGRPYDPQLSIALANSGYVQIELIQQRNDVPSLFRDFLSTVGEGPQHISHWVYDFDEKSKLLLDLGYRIGHSGIIFSTLRFAYFINDQMPGTIIEISDLNDMTEEYFKSVAEAASNWDGADPIRR